MTDKWKEPLGEPVAIPKDIPLEEVHSFLERMKKHQGVIIPNQDIKADVGKPRLSLVPTRAVEGIARIREYGCNKYPIGGQDNWKDVEPQRYIDALLRHAFAFKDDPLGVDEESGLPHLWHIGCNYAFLAELLGDDIGGREEM